MADFYDTLEDALGFGTTADDLSGTALPLMPRPNLRRPAPTPVARRGPFISPDLTNTDSGIDYVRPISEANAIDEARRNRAAVLQGLDPAQRKEFEMRTAQATALAPLLARGSNPDMAASVLRSLGINPMEQQKIDVARQKVAAEGGGGSPDDNESMAQSIASYAVPVSARMISDPRLRPIFARARQINPDYDFTQHNTRNKLRADFFGGGKTSMGIRSANRLVDHLDKLSDAVAALDPSDNQIANYGRNALLRMSGAPEISAVDTAATAVQSELATVFKGTGAAGTNQEMKEWRHNFDNKMSGGQYKSAIDEAVALLVGRLKPEAELWEKTFKKPLDVDLLDVGSREILKKRGLESKVPKWGKPANAEVPGDTKIRLDPSLSPEDRAMLERAGIRDNVSGRPAQGGAPKAGAVVRGYKFKGGDPSKKENWQKE